jgi:hypothetical protein
MTAIDSAGSVTPRVTSSASPLRDTGPLSPHADRSDDENSTPHDTSTTSIAPTPISPSPSRDSITPSSLPPLSQDEDFPPLSSALNARDQKRKEKRAKASSSSTQHDSSSPPTLPLSSSSPPSTPSLSPPSIPVTPNRFDITGYFRPSAPKSTASPSSPPSTSSSSPPPSSSSSPPPPSSSPTDDTSSDVMDISAAPLAAKRKRLDIAPPPSTQPDTPISKDNSMTQISKRRSTMSSSNPTASPPQDGSASPQASTSSSSLPARHNPQAGRPVGSGGPSKAALTQTLAAREEEIASLKKELLRLRSGAASIPTPPTAAASSTVPPSLPTPSSAQVPAAASPSPPHPPAQSPSPPPSCPLPAASSAPEGKEEKKEEGQEPRPSSGTASSSSPAGSAPSPMSRKKAIQAQPSASPPSSLKKEDRARPPQRLIQQLRLPAVSSTDLTMTVLFPPNICGRFTLDRPPRHSNNDSKLMYAICTLLLKGLGVPPPRLLKALSQHDTIPSLHTALLHLWTASPSSSTSPSPSPPSSSLPPSHLLTQQRNSFLQSIVATQHSLSSEFAAPLFSTPSSEPDSACHSHWHDYLSPATTLLSTSKSASGTRHVIRLAFNSALVTSAIRYHIERYTRLLSPLSPASAPSPPPTLTEAWQHSWVEAATQSNAIHTAVTLDVYGIRYDTTLVSGWTRGPDHLNPSPAHSNYDQLYGNLDCLTSFLGSAAPHCHIGPISYLADGTGSIQFIHEAKYRNELFRLNGSTSPSHGITRRLLLRYSLLHKPRTQCCSLCGESGHNAHNCPHISSAPPDSVQADAANLMNDDSPGPDSPRPGRSRAMCRDCYSPDHQQTCHTPPAQRKCKLCHADGHTSFRCTQYRPYWVPISCPPSSHPSNPRPLAIIAQQRGLPALSYSAALTGIAAPPRPPQPAPHFSPLDFPSLPSSSPAPHPPSSTSSSHSQPRTWSSAPPQSPSLAAAAEMADLRALISAQQTSIQSLEKNLAIILSLMQRLIPLPSPDEYSPTPAQWPPLPTPPVAAFMQQQESKVADPPLPPPPTTPSIPSSLSSCPSPAHPCPTPSFTFNNPLSSVSAMGNVQQHFHAGSIQRPDPSPFHPPSYHATAPAPPSHE